MAEITNEMALSPRQPLSGQRVRRIPGSAQKIATWNVRSLYEAGKLRNLTEEMERLKVDILGISEMRWTGKGECNTHNGKMYYSGNENEHQYGVAILVKKEIQKSVINFVPLTDRVMMIQIAAHPININIIQVYAPTAEKDENMVEEFYHQLKSVLQLVKKQELTIIMGDLNAKIGKGKHEDIVGEYGLGIRNDRGDRLLQFCQEEQLVVTNTYFKLPPRRLYTWTSPAHTSNNIIRNQIDYILVNKRFRNSIYAVKTYPGADIGSDHNPIIAKLKTRLKIIKTRNKHIRLDRKKLHDPSIQEEIKQKLGRDMQRIGEELGETDSDVNKFWKTVKEPILKITTEQITSREKMKKSEWMNNEILQLMEDRRKVKNINIEKYKQIQRTIRRKIREAKEKWMTDRCAEIEELDKKYDTFNLHKRIKEVTGNYKTRKSNILLNDDGKIQLNIEEKLQTWKLYIQQLFDDNRIPQHNYNNASTGPYISKEEVTHAVKNAKSGKALGPDEVYAEVIKMLDDTGIYVLTKLFNIIYDTGAIPNEWLTSTFVTIPKTTNAKRCNEYRTISLMSQTLKIFLKIIHNRIYKRCEAVISESQFGFRNGLGTREALFSLQILVERCRDVNVDVYLCFVDYEKAFDRVQHEKLLEILTKIGLDDKDVRIIMNLYWNQTADVRVEGESTEQIKILRGVRQGCILSPLLFNIYSEAIFTEALNGGEYREEGININGKRLNNLRYADDTVLLAENEHELQTLINCVNNCSNRFGLNINKRKTKIMVISKNRNVQTNIMIEGKRLEQVEKYKYLGCIINEKWDHSTEIKSRIEQARAAFLKMRKLICCPDLNLQLRMRIVRCYVLPVLLYGVEAWTLTQATVKKIEAFEMWIYRRILKISWVKRVRNETVLQRMGKDREIINTIKKRKIEYLGHIMRNQKYQLLQLIIQGKIQGKRSAGRRRISWLKNLRTWFGKSTKSLFRAAVSKVEIALMVANLR